MKNNYWCIIMVLLIVLIAFISGTSSLLKFYSGEEYDGADLIPLCLNLSKQYYGDYCSSECQNATLNCVYAGIMDKPCPQFNQTIKFLSLERLNGNVQITFNQTSRQDNYSITKIETHQPCFSGTTVCNYSPLREADCGRINNDCFSEDFYNYTLEPGDHISVSVQNHDAPISIKFTLSDGECSKEINFESLR